MTDKQRLAVLYTLRSYIQTPEFQEFIMKPVFAELEKIQKLKGYKTWDEVLKAQGKEAGLMKLLDILKANELDAKNTRYTLESDEA